MYGLGNPIKKIKFQENPLEKLGKNKTLKDFIHKKRNSNPNISQSVDKDDKYLAKAENHSRLKKNCENHLTNERVSSINIEDLTKEFSNQSRNYC